MIPTDTDRFLADLRARLAALPSHLSIERHGDGEAIYSCRDQPIDPDRPVSHTNRQHGWQIAFVREYDHRMWPPVRAFLTSAPGDMARLLALVEELGREVLRLRGTQPRPDEPETAPRGNPESDGISDPESLRMRLRLAGRLIAHVEQHLASPVGPSGKRHEARAEGGMWVSCGLEGLSLHDSADEAREAAEEWLGECRERAPEGWPEETVGIMWGEIVVHGRVVEIEHRPRADGDPPGPWDEWVDYALRPVGAP